MEELYEYILFDSFNCTTVCHNHINGSVADTIPATKTALSFFSFSGFPDFIFQLSVHCCVLPANVRYCSFFISTETTRQSAADTIQLCLWIYNISGR